MNRVKVKIEGINPVFGLEKLKREGIFVYQVRKITKNALNLEVERKDCEKVFAILQSSCYNVSKIGERGLSALLNTLKRGAGLLVGMALSLFLVLFSQTRVLCVRVEGSGSYYEEETLALLSQNGIAQYGRMIEDTATVKSQILSLPRVSFCEISHVGGTLTVQIEVSDEKEPIVSRPLLSPVTGVVEELLVLRGTACKEVGQSVLEGETLVQNYTLFEQGSKQTLVIARAKISFEVDEIFQGERENALLQATLKYGEIENVFAIPVDRGWRIMGKASVELSENLA